MPIPYLDERKGTLRTGHHFITEPTLNKKKKHTEPLTFSVHAESPVDMHDF